MYKIFSNSNIKNNDISKLILYLEKKYKLIFMDKIDAALMYSNGDEETFLLVSFYQILIVYSNIVGTTEDGLPADRIPGRKYIIKKSSGPEIKRIPTRSFKSFVNKKFECGIDYIFLKTLNGEDYKIGLLLEGEDDIDIIKGFKQVIFNLMLDYEKEFIYAPLSEKLRSFKIDDKGYYTPYYKLSNFEYREKIRYNGELIVSDIGWKIFFYKEPYDKRKRGYGVTINGDNVNDLIASFYLNFKYYERNKDVIGDSNCLGHYDMIIYKDGVLFDSDYVILINTEEVLKNVINTLKYSQKRAKQVQDEIIRYRNSL